MLENRNSGEFEAGGVLWGKKDRDDRRKSCKK